MIEAYTHQAVMLEEVIAALNIKPGGVYFDGTFGRGGHSSAILQRLGETGHLYAVDRDPEAIAHGKKIITDERLTLIRGTFSSIYDIAKEAQLLGKVDGILLDLGVSSPQLDDASRGFSFLRDGPLDMRMDPEKGMSAAEWINAASEEEISRVLKEYGEERFHRRVAHAIVQSRTEKSITTTHELAYVIKGAIPKKDFTKHPATKSFQGIRIYINEELKELEDFLEKCVEIMSMGGRLAIIGFHSLEDRIVKRFMKKLARGDEYPRDLPIQQIHIQQPPLKIVQWGVKASEQEVRGNPRARSAILRVAEKLR